MSICFWFIELVYRFISNESKSGKVIRIKDESRKGTDLSAINEVDGLKDILNKDFFEKWILMVGEVSHLSNGFF